MANVDTSIHDRTTGRAATFAAVHSSPALSHGSFVKPTPPSPPATQYLTLYGSWFCPFVQRVWLVLHEKSIPHHYVEINPYKKEKHFLELNPRGLVPTLAIQETSAAPAAVTDQEMARHPRQNGVANPSANLDATAPSFEPQSKPEGKEKVLYESSVVLDYLDQVYNTNLYPFDPYSHARTKLWIDHISSRIVPSFYRFLQHTPQKDYTLDSAREEFVKHIHTFAAELDEEGPWFNGAEMGMADVMLIPWAMRVFLLDHYKGGSGIPEAVKQRNKKGGRSMGKVAQVVPCGAGEGLCEGYIE